MIVHMSTFLNNGHDENNISNSSSKVASVMKQHNENFSSKNLLNLNAHIYFLTFKVPRAGVTLTAHFFCQGRTPSMFD